MALSFSSVSESPNWPCGRKGGLKERGEGYVERFYINVSLNTRIRTSYKNV